MAIIVATQGTGETLTPSAENEGKTFDVFYLSSPWGIGFSRIAVEVVRQDGGGFTLSAATPSLPDGVQNSIQKKSDELIAIAQEGTESQSAETEESIEEEVIRLRNVQPWCDFITAGEDLVLQLPPSFDMEPVKLGQVHSFKEVTK